jgi:hypothetical protein
MSYLGRGAGPPVFSDFHNMASDRGEVRFFVLAKMPTVLVDVTRVCG